MTRVKAGDLLRIDDHQGTHHLAVVSMEEYADLWRPELGRPSPEDELFVAYFSDHPGTSVRRADAVSAIDELERPMWYLPPLREALEASFLTEPAKDAVELALTSIDDESFLESLAGDTCPRTGLWILRGTNYSINLQVGATMPRYAFYPGSVQPPQWCRWNLPLV